MSKPSPRHKTALVLGADSPVGRSIALTLSRDGCHVVLAGYHADRLKILADLIEAKKGDPLVAVIPREAERIVPVLRAARETMGHYHFIINALATLEPPADQPQFNVERAVDLHARAWEVIEGRGTVRFLLLWPDEAKAPLPTLPEPKQWFSVIRYDRIQMETEAADPEAIRAAGAADTVSLLINAPASACPVEVRLAIRELKNRGE
jgi:NAD(P)-dependent dehydrogenase (short-subunit alcohol dehydrogenase family)